MEDNGIRLRNIYGKLRMFSPATDINIEGCKQLWKIFGVPSKPQLKKYAWGSFQDGTKFPSTPLQPFASLGYSQ